MRRILTHHPQEYLQQGFSGCGAHSVKAILSAYKKDNKENPYDYYTNFLSKYTGTPVSSTTWVKVLKSYGINAKSDNAKHLSDAERISLLKSLIDRDAPVMLRIGNGYLPSGKYSNFTASFIGHWITLWGYNEEDQTFYIYDSGIPIDKHNKSIPIGNTTRTFKEIIRDWDKGFPWWWRYNYIEIQ